MKVGDKIQVRRFDGVDHWVYAIVLATGEDGGGSIRIQIAHPGNREDNAVMLVGPADIRTRADLQNIIDQAQAIVAKAGRQGLTEAQVRELGQIDGFWLSFVTPTDGRLTEHQSRHLSAQQTALHQRVVKHYQAQLKNLS